MKTNIQAKQNYILEMYAKLDFLETVSKTYWFMIN